MYVTIECATCGAINRVDIGDVVRTIIESAEDDSIFAGFLCTDCAETDEED